MIQFFLLAAGLHLLSTALLGAGMFGIAPLLFVLPVAWHWATGCRTHALALMAIAGLAPLGVDWRVAAAAVMVAGLGVLLGAMLQKQWHFGRIVAGLTVAAFMPLASVTILNWETVLEGYEIWSTARIAEFDAAAAEQSNQGNDSFGQQTELVHETFQWIGEHAAFLNLGWSFGTVLVVMTLMVTLINRRLLRKGHTAHAAGTFKDMRPSEWLVWGAILLAAGWFIDQRWPSEVLRMVTWNGAFAMATVYWLNGLSILVYGFLALRGGALMAVTMLMVLFMLAGLQTLPAAIGLFDTWFDLRRRFDRLAELRRMREQNGNEND